jgi:hypothetical protein
MNRNLFALALACAVALASCSTTSDNSVGPPPFNPRGTAVGPDHVFNAASPLAWGTSNEVVGFSSATPAAGSGLLAIGMGSGVVRVLDPATPLAMAMSDDGAEVVYVADLPPADGDSTVLRRLALAGGAATRVAACADGCFITFALSHDGNWVAWSGTGSDPLEPDTLRLVELATGDITTVGLGAPVALAPDGSQMLYRPDPGSPALHMWTRAGGTDDSFDPGFPTGAGPAAWRWDAQGLRALYIEAPRKLHLTNPGLGTDTFTLLPDDLDIRPPIWSPDGSHAAVWGSRLAPSQNYTEHNLYVVNLSSHAVTDVASGSEAPGAVAFTVSATRVAYLYGERLYTNPVSATAATLAPGTAVQRGTAAPASRYAPASR